MYAHIDLWPSLFESFVFIEQYRICRELTLFTPTTSIKRNQLHVGNELSCYIVEINTTNSIKDKNFVYIKNNDNLTKGIFITHKHLRRIFSLNLNFINIFHERQVYGKMLWYFSKPILEKSSQHDTLQNLPRNDLTFLYTLKR